MKHVALHRKVKSLFQQVDSSGDGTLNLEECLERAPTDVGYFLDDIFT